MRLLCGARLSLAHTLIHSADIEKARNPAYAARPADMPYATMDDSKLLCALLANCCPLIIVARNPKNPVTMMVDFAKFAGPEESMAFAIRLVPEYPELGICPEQSDVVLVKSYAADALRHRIEPASGPLLFVEVFLRRDDRRILRRPVPPAGFRAVH